MRDSLFILSAIFMTGALSGPAFTFAQGTTTDTIQKPAKDASAGNGPLRDTQKLTAVGVSAVWGRIDGVAIEGMVQGPSTEVTPLQVACVFEYTEGDIFNSPPALPAAANGMLHLDHDLKGLITELRKSGKFAGHAFETLLITPPAGSISAGKLLLIGLGDRTKFTPELMIGIGGVAMREALRLGVGSYAFASDLKDGGVDSPTALVAEYVVKGSFDAYRTEAWLRSQKMSDSKPLTKVTLLAGPPFFTVAGQGIKEAIASFNHRGAAVQ